MSTTAWIVIALAVAAGWYFVAGPGAGAASPYTTGVGGFAGTKPSGPTYNNAPTLASDIGKGVCIGGGAAIGVAIGNPFAGAAVGSSLSPLCGAVAPVVGRAITAGAKEVASIGGKLLSPLRPVLTDTIAAVRPLAAPASVLAHASVAVALAPTTVAVAGVKALGASVGSAIHSPIGLLTAPVVVPTKVAVAVTKSVVGTAVNVVKSLNPLSW